MTDIFCAPLHISSLPNILCIGKYNTAVCVYIPRYKHSRSCRACFTTERVLYHGVYTKLKKGCQKKNQNHKQYDPIVFWENIHGYSLLDRSTCGSAGSKNAVRVSVFFRFKGCVGWVVSNLTKLNHRLRMLLHCHCPKELQAPGSRNRNLKGFEVGMIQIGRMFTQRIRNYRISNHVLLFQTLLDLPLIEILQFSPNFFIKGDALQ
jgi:hypothetical protein